MPNPDGRGLDVYVLDESGAIWEWHYIAAWSGPLLFVPIFGLIGVSSGLLCARWWTQRGHDLQN